MWQSWKHKLLLTSMLVLGMTQANAQSASLGLFNLPLIANTPIPGSIRVPGDMDGNGVSDIFWYNPDGDQFGYWLMDVNDSTGAVSRIGLKVFDITPGYYPAAVGDFFGNGLANVIFTSGKNDLYLWKNNGSGGFTSTQLENYPAGWVLIGAGDVDGEDDLLWLNPATCQFGYWLMKNGVHTSSKITNISCGYYPLSIGYYTPTNKISIVWTSTNNDLWIWDSNGSGFASYQLQGFGLSNPIAFGGGYAGQNIMYATAGAANDSPFDSVLLTNGVISRQFNGANSQISYGMGAYNSQPEPAAGVDDSAGVLVEGRNINMTSTINAGLSLCTPTFGATYTVPTGSQCTTVSTLNDPLGWFIFGALNTTHQGATYPP
jgi:hypothetical protein